MVNFLTVRTNLQFTYAETFFRSNGGHSPRLVPLATPLLVTALKDNSNGLVNHVKSQTHQAQLSLKSKLKNETKILAP